MLASSVCQLLTTVALASTSVLAWEKTHNWKYLDGYPLVIQPDRLIQVKGNVSYPGPPSEGPLRLTTTEDQIASCVVSIVRSTLSRHAHPPSKIDYGAVYTGLDFYNIAASDNTPILRITYSDSLDFVDTGDTMYKTMIQDHNTERQRNYTLDAATTRIESYSSTTFRYVKLEILTVGSGTFRVGALGKTVASARCRESGTHTSLQVTLSLDRSHTSRVTFPVKALVGKSIGRTRYPGRF